MILDMMPHWRYVLDNLFAEVRAISCLGATMIPERRDETGRRYPATADDACFATMTLADGTIAHFNCSWAGRVRRDDLLTLQVDGTDGSAVVGLREVVTQARANTPRPVWNPDAPATIDYYAGWQAVPDKVAYDNAFKAQWQLFVRHMFDDAPFPWDLMAGAKGVQLAELATRSWTERRWVDVPALEV